MLRPSLQKGSAHLAFLVLCILFVKSSSAHCPSHQFECGNGRCIPMTWHCDDDNDCGDNTDESSCELRTCSETEFKCQNSKCVPLRWLCDNEDDCGDKSDEHPRQCQNKTCAPDQFSCGSTSGLCIPITWRCDGQEDCADGLDEKDECHQITCTEEEFTCDNNKCITKRWVCDQDNDCGDFSDEKNCPNVTCSASEFMCVNGKCIPDRWRCDGDVDCLDGSDEATCPKQTLRSTCSSTEFMCKSRDCIHLDWVCDGDADCPDRSDEQNCTVSCRSDQFRCNNNRCIAGTLQCDGKQDCSDGSDETNCPSVIPEACDPTKEFDCGGKHCIANELVCNGKNDCGNWEDEPHGKCFVNECNENNGGCSQKCVNDVIGYHCDCFSGYQLLDNQTCEDINECEIYGTCSQLCNNTKGSFKCSCLEGYSIEPSNHRRCKAQQGHTALLFSNRRDLRKINLETSEYTLVASGLRSAVAIDYDYGKKTIVWTDVLEGRVYSAPLRTGEPITEVASSLVVTPDGIAIDWIHENVYWTDTGIDSINVAQLNGDVRKTLFMKNLDEPRAIVVNPLEGWMFWADWGDVKIERAGMDGTHRSVIVSKNIQWPNGLALDLVSRKIFWADAKLHTISCANFDGSDQHVVLSSPTEVKHPFSLDVFEDWLYWTDWESESILKVDKFTGKNLRSVATGISSPMGMRVYHSYKQPKGPNRCGDMNGGCSHMCLPAPHLSEGSAKYTCACPNGMVLSDNGLNCLSLDLPITKPAPTLVSSTTRKNRIRPLTTSKPLPSTTQSSTTIKISSVSTTQAYTSTSSVEATTFHAESSPQTIDTLSVIQTTLKPSQQSMFMNETLREIQEVIDDSGRIAGIIIGVLTGLTLVLALVGFCLYKQYLRRNITSMNFDNPVYRKTTEDQFSLEKNQYQPARSYPSSLEPLTSPGTNEFV
ncbi:low-density lipoprotein receptor [Trichonephila clavata]|uniref:Low-density lipoprotein receptor n=1 Tax=Trichonephila clavata TaxID=2740835 RepID=A0A8X6F3J6_TRICU|nr:low-density lipoprotein receptor [Trichonephila clavata]